MRKVVVMQVPEEELSRTATSFIKEANAFSSRVTVAQNGKCVNAKSLLGILSLRPEVGTEVELTAEGDDAEKALEILGAILEKKY